MIAIQDLLFLAGIVIAITKVATVLINYAFCVKPLARWIRLWQEGAILLIGTRLAAAQLFELQRDWTSVVLWWNLAIVSFLIAWKNGERAIIHGDRCNPRPPIPRYEAAMTILCLLMALAASLVGLFG